MQLQHLTRIALVLALAGAGAALAQGQVCIHRTADGRCLHWVPAQSGPGPVSDQRQQYTPPPAAAPTSGCVYDSGSGVYRQCFHITADGRCVHFGGRCN